LLGNIKENFMLITRIALASALVVASLCWSGSPVRAANADNPYENIDPRFDAGNNTGDWMVERLNQEQLEGIGRSHWFHRHMMEERMMEEGNPYYGYGDQW
jgi:hypothetical protein